MRPSSRVCCICRSHRKVPSGGSTLAMVPDASTLPSVPEQVERSKAEGSNLSLTKASHHPFGERVAIRAVAGEVGAGLSGYFPNRRPRRKPEVLQMWGLWASNPIDVIDLGPFQPEPIQRLLPRAQASRAGSAWRTASRALLWIHPGCTHWRLAVDARQHEGAKMARRHALEVSTRRRPKPGRERPPEHSGGCDVEVPEPGRMESFQQQVIEEKS